jgi:general secretion pathway protein G
MAVIGVIILLMVICLPVVRLLRESANTTACASNLRQIGASALLYSQEHGNRTLPPNYYGALKNDGYLPVLNRRDMLECSGVWMCPEDSKDRIEVAAESTDSIRNISYGYNAQRIGLPPAYWATSKITVFDITEPEKTLYLCDAKSYYLNRGNKNALFRHPGNRINILFFDCHVESIKEPEEITEFYAEYL